jgi:hypothetical protein
VRRPVPRGLLPAGTTGPPAGRLWKDIDLADRWGIDHDSLETVHDIVRERHVSFLWMGRGEINLARISWRCVRFRERDIEAWEANQVIRTKTPGSQTPVVGSAEDDLLGGKRAIKRHQG